MNQPCPCGSNAEFMECCGRFIDLGVATPDPEKLMRSRYTAYVLRNAAYLRKTWHPESCPVLSDLTLAQTTWIALEIHRSKSGFKQGLVEFSAHFEADTGTQSLHEISRFRKIKNRWFYLDALPEWPGSL